MNNKGFKKPNYGAVKMGYNPRANPTHHGFGSGWVEKSYKFQYGLKMNPTH